MTSNDGSKERRDTRRRFEQWARNPRCEANARSAVLGVPMKQVAEREGARAPYGQSPFALARGQTFEAALLRNDGERLFQALVAAGVLLKGELGFRDLRLRQHRGPMANLDAALAATKGLLERLASAGSEGAPEASLVAGAAIEVPGELMLPSAVLVIDALVVRRRNDKVELVVGEVKTYPDRGGHTDGGELATARAQAGVYVHGLRLVLEELELSERVSVAERGFLVLSRPGSNMPSVRADEDLRFQVERARRGFEQLRAAARQFYSMSEAPDGASVVAEAPVHYCEACISFCERVSVCRERAEKAGNPALLGSDMAHWLGEIRLDRALALLGGAAPGNPAERDFVDRVQSEESAE